MLDGTWSGIYEVVMQLFVTYCPTSLFSLIFIAQTKGHKPVHKLQEFFLGLPSAYQLLCKAMDIIGSWTTIERFSTEMSQ